MSNAGRGMVGVALMAILVVGQARAACPAGAEWVRTDAQAVRTARAAGDTAALDQAAAGLLEDVGCLTEILSPQEAVNAHVAFATKAAQDGDQAQLLASFRAVLLSDPAFVPDDALAPLGSPARAAFDEARVRGPGGAAELPAQPGFVWVVDGTPGAPLPTERAAIVWLQGPQGDVVKSRYFPQGGVPADLVGAEQVAVGAVIIGQKSSEMAGDTPLSRHLAIGAGAAAGASILGMIIAGSIKSSYVNAPPEDGLLESKVTANHVVGYSAIGMGVGALGLGGAAVVIGRW